MIGIIMNVRVKAGSVDRFAQLTAQLQADVRASERGCQMFQVLQQVDDPTQFSFVEFFVDEAALIAHPDMPYHKAMSAAGWECVDGQPTVTKFNPVSLE